MVLILAMFKVQIGISTLHVLQLTVQLLLTNTLNGVGPRINIPLKYFTKYFCSAKIILGNCKNNKNATCYLR